MHILQEVQESVIKTAVPKMRTGNTVKVHQKIKEGAKERIQIFEGLIIKVNSGHAADKTVTVRKMVGGIGVEKIFPIHSPLFTFEVVKEAKVRRSKLYYMRDRSGKSARLKETFVSKQVMEEIPEANRPKPEPVVEAKAEEAPKEEVKAETKEEKAE